MKAARAGALVQLVDDYDCVLFHTKHGARAAVKFGKLKKLLLKF